MCVQTAQCHSIDVNLHGWFEVRSAGSILAMSRSAQLRFLFFNYFGPDESHISDRPVQSMSDTTEEIAVLRDLLSREKKYRMEIEDERDFLLEDNTRLRGELERFKMDYESVSRSMSSRTSSQSMGTVKSVSTFGPSEKTFANILKAKVSDACGGKNAVCTAFLAYKSVNELEAPHNAAFPDSSSDIWLCGGVDAHLSGYDSQTEAQLFSVKLSAPLLSIDVHGANVACGMMDGSHTIVSALLFANLEEFTDNFFSTSLNRSTSTPRPGRSRRQRPSSTTTTPPTRPTPAPRRPARPR